MVTWFTAKFDGRCAACNKRFLEGGQIANVDGEYVARNCCDGTGYAEFTKFMPPRTQASDVCRKCFIIHATGQGECE